jgi:hypothetical protein
VAELVEQEQAQELGRHEVTNARAVTVALITAGVASIAATWFLAVETRRASAPKPPPPVQDARDEVTGLAGEIALENGARLSVRIARLHSERERQRFDAEALRRRFELKTGEPFACELRFFEGHDAAGTSATAAIELSNLHLVDAQGTALAPLAAPAPSALTHPAQTNPEQSAIADPLATLLAPPSGALAPGQSICLVLWGREPAKEARLVLGNAPEIALSSAALRRADIDSSLARIEVARTVARAADDR